MQKGKNIFEEYVAYIKDNPKRYWFKRRLYGWGWTPATWEGWLSILVFLGAIVGNAFRVDSASYSTEEFLWQVIPATFILVGLLIGLCFWKGESPKWMWGIPKKDDEPGNT